MNEKFNVGDKVECHGRWNGSSIGKIIKITEKRRDITVDFGHYTIVFDNYGHQRGVSTFEASYITKLTAEREQELIGKRTILLCKKAVEKADITVEQAKQILAILR